MKSLENWLTLYRESRNEQFKRQYLQRVGEAADEVSRLVQLELAPWQQTSES